MRRSQKIKRLGIALGICAAGGLILGSFAFASLLKDLPDPSRLKERKIAESTKIYDRTGQILLYEIHGDEKRTVVPLANIPKSIQNATIALEDANFYKHGGIDVRGIFRALFVDITSQNLQQGGSTITQQLVKISLLGNERTFARKIKEAVLSMLLESRYSKDDILGMYLNQIPYGSNAYGIEAAAETYFGTSTENVSLAEAALLASLPRAPSYYSPYGSHVDELMARKDFALDRMAELGYITADEAKQAKKEKLVFQPAQETGLLAPHFVMYVRDLLTQTYGEETVAEGGLRVTTTLDWNLQQEAEKIVKEGADFNTTAITAYNAALVAIDPKTGDILAMVGSKDYWGDPEPAGCTPGLTCHFDPRVNVVTRARQPGSSFKPFVYATAFQKGYTPDTVLFDVPTEFNPLCSPDGAPAAPNVKPEDCYHPGNYDKKFRGPVTLRQAIAQSLNVPSVKVLYLAGVDDSINTAEAMGLTTLGDRSRFGLSLVLGGAEVKLLEMTSAYGAFAAEGVLHRKSPILRVVEGGKVLEEKQDQATQVVDTEVARTITDVLSDDNARVPEFRPHGSLWLPDRPVAAKTGTTQDYRDAWTIGYTPSLVVGVWAGNNDNSPMHQEGSGVLAAAPIWNKFMQAATKNTLPEFFTKPEAKKSEKPILNGLWQGDQILRIDTVSGKLATALTPEDTTEEVAYGTPHDPLFWINKNDPAGPPPENPYRDPQYKNWSAAFSKWLAASGISGIPLSAAPTASDDVHTLDAKPHMALQTLQDNGDSYSFTISVQAKFAIKEVDAIALDSLVATGYAENGQVTLTIQKDQLGTPPPPIHVKAYDVVGNWNEIIIPFNGSG